MDYPVTLERDGNGTILVSFPDFPEAHTFGEDEADALVRAKDALATAIDAYIKDRRDIPLPSAVVARHKVTTPAIVEQAPTLRSHAREEGQQVRARAAAGLASSASRSAAKVRSSR